VGSAGAVKQAAYTELTRVMSHDDRGYTHLRSSSSTVAMASLTATSQASPAAISASRCSRVYDIIKSIKRVVRPEIRHKLTEDQGEYFGAFSTISEGVPYRATAKAIKAAKIYPFKKAVAPKEATMTLHDEPSGADARVRSSFSFWGCSRQFPGGSHWDDDEKESSALYGVCGWLVGNDEERREEDIITYLKRSVNSRRDDRKVNNASRLSTMPSNISTKETLFPFSSQPSR